MIKSLILLLLAILPTVLIGIYVYKNDKHKEPISILLLLFILGIISALTVIFLSYLLELIIPTFTKSIYQMNIIELVLKTFIEVALIEEICKWVIVYFIGYKNKEFDETYDVIIYAIFVGLGFATFENISYIFDHNAINVAIQRGIFSVPGHVSYAIFMSYYLCLAKISSLKGNKSKEKINILKSILVPTLLHGVYDFCLFTEKNIYIIVFFAFSVILFLMAFQQLRQLYKSNATLLNIKKTCSNCGQSYYGNICPRCRHRQD